MHQYHVLDESFDQSAQKTENTRIELAKQKWAKQRAEHGAPPKPKIAPLLTQAQIHEPEDLQGCIKQRIDRMKRHLDEQYRRSTRDQRSERVNELMGPAIRSVIRGRERILTVLNEHTIK